MNSEIQSWTLLELSSSAWVNTLATGDAYIIITDSLHAL